MFGSYFAATYFARTYFPGASAGGADADLGEFLPVETRVRFFTVQGRDRFFPVIPDPDPLDVP